MGQVFIWHDQNASSSYTHLIRRLNSVLLISTGESEPWKVNLRVYRQRSDLKRSSAYDAIPEALEKSLLDTLLDTTEESIESTKTFVLFESSLEKGAVWAVQPGAQHLKFNSTTSASVEQILVPKKDADYRLRQTVVIEGIHVHDKFRLGLVYAGADSVAVMLEVLSDIDVNPILPRPVPVVHNCTNVPELIAFFQASRVI